MCCSLRSADQESDPVDISTQFLRTYACIACKEECESSQNSKVKIQEKLEEKDGSQVVVVELPPPPPTTDDECLFWPTQALRTVQRVDPSIWLPQKGSPPVGTEETQFMPEL